ncbi:MAG: PaeR7I family type II restriction endonuclease [Lysobacterales bacterium]
MTVSLLPEDFDERVNAAVRRFWAGRSGTAAERKQGGTRDNVVGGQNMNGFIDLVDHVATHCGLPADSVHRRKSKVALPGFFRPTKDWDAVVIHKQRLLGVFEFKSQVGSFGKNFNNRSEEVIGSAADLWVAHHQGAYGHRPAPRTDIGEESPALLNPIYQADPRPPFVGWLMLLEESEKSLTPVRCAEPHFSVFPEFNGASYARRYQLLCERLVERRLYSAAALELSVAGSETSRPLSVATSIRNLFAEFAGRVLAAAET